MCCRCGAQGWPPRPPVVSWKLARRPPRGSVCRRGRTLLVSRRQSPVKRALISTIVIATLSALAQPASGQAACEPSVIDTADWREHSVPKFGLGFLAPPRYVHKIWASRADSTSDREDYWPAHSVRWRFFIETAPATALLVPRDTTNYSACLESWTGYGGQVERYQAGWMTTGPTTRAVPYHVRASWRLPNGRVLLFRSAGTDSLPLREMYGVVRSIQFTRPPE